MRTLALLLALLSATPAVAQNNLPANLPKPTPAEPVADARWLALKKQRLQPLFQQRHELLQRIEQMKSTSAGPAEQPK